MSNRKTKKRHVEYDPALGPHHPITVKLPDICRKSVRTHINTIYVGTIIRIYDPRFETEGQLATAHWCTIDGVYVTLHNEQKCDFVDLKYKKWVVDHRCVKVGAFKLFSKASFNDIEDDIRNKTINEIKQRNHRILMNYTYMDFLTRKDRETYDCTLFQLTCNCGCSKQVVKYTCSQNNTVNAGRRYYGCSDRYTDSQDSCNFFVWESEIEHEKYITCECGRLCKKVNVSKEGLLPVFKFICIDRYNKMYPGCKVYIDA